MDRNPTDRYDKEESEHSIYILKNEHKINKRFLLSFSSYLTSVFDEALISVKHVRLMNVAYLFFISYISISYNIYLLYKSIRVTQEL